MKFKIFSKKLTKIDVEKRLSVTTRSLTSFPPSKEYQNYQDIMVEDEGENPRLFRLIIGKGLYIKPVHSVGWLDFVKKMKLQRGFKAKFFREEDEVIGEVKYKVKIKKPYVVFKSELGYVSHYYQTY